MLVCLPCIHSSLVFKISLSIYNATPVYEPKINLSSAVASEIQSNSLDKHGYYIKNFTCINMYLNIYNNHCNAMGFTTADFETL